MDRISINTFIAQAITAAVEHDVIDSIEAFVMGAEHGNNPKSFFDSLITIAEAQRHHNFDGLRAVVRVRDAYTADIIRRHPKTWRTVLAA